MDSHAAERVKTIQSVLSEKYDLLSRCLVVSHRFLMKLKSVKSSDYWRSKVPQIRQQKTADEQVTELLTILDEVPDSEQQSAYDWFLWALRQDGQEHVANIFVSESDTRPMSDEHYQLLFSQQSQVCQYLDTANGLVDELFKRQVFTDIDYKSVMKKTEQEAMSREVIKIILRKPDATFDEFISALITTNQEHLASLLGHECSEKPLSEEHCQLLIRETEQLSQFINPTYALFNSLVDIGVFNKRDIDIVASKSCYTDMAIELVKVLLRKSDSSFDKFIEALNNTEQQHVVHILTGQGVSPLSHLRRLVLRKARDRLVNRVDALHTSLLAKMISSGILTDSEKQRIEAHKTNEARIAELIDVIARKSQLAYDAFLQALKDSGHREVAEFLEGLELKGRIDPQFLSDTPLPDKNTIVQLVRNKLKALVSCTGHEVKEFTSLMEQNGFAVSEIEDGSILISFRCFTEESLENLARLYNDKTLDKLLTRVFCPQFADQGLESLTLRIMNSEFQKVSESFRQIEDFERTRQLSALPVEMFELMLMKTFIELFNDHYKSHRITHEAIRQVYTMLAGVCDSWWQTMNGWPQSTTKHWFKHKLQRALTFVCRPYIVSPRLQHTVKMPYDSTTVLGVAACDNKLYVLCWDSIRVFGPNNKELTNYFNIELEQLDRSRDIVSCTETRQLYVAIESRDSAGSVWRVSLNSRKAVSWLPNKSTTTSQFRPWTLSLTSRRLLVTSEDNNELLLYGADGVELKRVPLPDIKSLQHAVETSHGTFILCHRKPQPRVCEVDVAGHVTRVYCDQQQLSYPAYLLLDSDGRIFAAENKKNRILVLLLNSETLELERVLLQKQRHSLTQYPWRLCFTQQTRQLAVSGRSTESHVCCSVQLFTVR